MKYFNLIILLLLTSLFSIGSISIAMDMEQSEAIFEVA
jgi:hypothetical protein